MACIFRGGLQILLNGKIMGFNMDTIDHGLLTSGLLVVLKTDIRKYQFICCIIIPWDSVDVHWLKNKTQSKHIRPEVGNVVTAQCF